MKYFLDTEFHEYHKQQKCFGIKIGKLIPTIDLISIGIVSEAHVKGYDIVGTGKGELVEKSYYAISKDFNIKDAWYSWQLKSYSLSKKTPIKEYWLRENVLKPIFKELFNKEYHISETIVISTKDYYDILNKSFTLQLFTKLIRKYGKSNKQIAKEIIEFLGEDNNIEFYGYYSDYDWVVFAQLFGKMIDLPRNFPMYCKDLKQIMDEKLDKKILPIRGYLTKPNISLDSKLKEIKTYPNYPKQENEHNALDDARWNYELYKFLQTI